MTDLRTIERESIRAFVQSAADGGYLSGRVLDYGCGKQPYRGIVEAAGGEYHGYDRENYPANVSGQDHGAEDWRYGTSEESWNAILCTQVLQYVPLYPYYSQLENLLSEFFLSLENYDLPPSQGGLLVLTYPTNWPEVEPEDLHRFTKAGMERLLTEAGFEIVRHERRAAVLCGLAETPPNIEGTSIGRLEADRFALGYGCVARA